jgi:UDPglucose--hexose-1-phosphate uridylyltransferase
MLHTPHRRYNPLTGEYILVSPHRHQRPWQGSVETEPLPTPQTLERTKLSTNHSYEPSCYLCPGNTRIKGDINPHYQKTFVFHNDTPALLPSTSTSSSSSLDHHPHLKSQFFKTEPTMGLSRVICFSPQHDLTLAEMSPEAIDQVLITYQEQLQDLKNDYAVVQIFENKGQLMGCSSPHPHAQLWASTHIPTEIMKEDAHQKAFFEASHQPLLFAYALEELSDPHKERIVIDEKDWLVVVPFWATWPFETLILPKFKAGSLLEISANQRENLAKTLKNLLVTYDQLFQTSFPYSMGWHNAPFDLSPSKDKNYSEYWQVHAHFYPPLLRSASIRKFMVGYEMLAEAQRDITPEQAAEQLRKRLYSHKN